MPCTRKIATREGPLEPVIADVVETLGLSDNVSDILEATAPTQTSTSVTSKSLNPIPFDTVTFSRGSRLGLTGTGRVSVTEAGIYQFSVTVHATGASDVEYIYMSAVSSGGNPVWQTWREVGNTSAEEVSLTGFLRATASDELDFYIEATRAASGTIEFNSLTISVVRIGGIPAS